VVAPSGPFDADSFEQGRARLEGRYRVHVPDGLFAQARYLAGTDTRRLDELRAAFLSPHAEAIFSARGGYGAMRLLPQLDLAALPPKPLVGFSDISALHLALQARGIPSVHGPVLTQLATQPEEVFTRLTQLLESSEPPPPLEATTCLVPGRAEGTLLGGNLSVVTRLLGTPFFPAHDGAILLLEDVGERPYRLDRMWTHLRLAGVFDRIVGIVLGDFTGCEEKDQPYSSAEVLADLARQTGLPCAAGFPIGHGAVNFPVPLGRRVRLYADELRLEFLEPLVDLPGAPP
jgi:muramoyltetrapeptide carboxypeptidase